MINKVTLIGHLGNDPEIRHFEGGSKVTKFQVATNESYQNRDGQWQSRTEWHTVVCWGNLAERAERTLKKGHLIYIDGKISSRTWQDSDGNDRKSISIVTNYFRSLERREASEITEQLSKGENFPKIEEEFPKDSSSKISTTATLPKEDDLPF